MAAWRNLGRALRTSNINTIDCRPVLRRLSGRGRRSRTAVARSVKTILEALEGRQMMSVLPAPTAIGAFDVVAPANNDINRSSAVLAVNPLNSLKMVSAHVSIGDDTTTSDGQSVFVHAEFSVAGGTTWSSLAGIQPNLIDPAIAGGAT